MQIGKKRFLRWLLIVPLALIFMLAGGLDQILKHQQAVARSSDIRHRFPEKNRQAFMSDKHMLLKEDALICKDCHGVDDPKEKADPQKCVDCHESKDIIAATLNMFPTTPHVSHYGEIKCTLCHKGHQKQELYCNICHFFELKKK